ncbi:MAG: TIGR02281 family clan AA aspartic protease [Betaproteobacteria bacterium]|jgi:aspartyl protease family protein|nr:TIGR02281 family clan AA aspartic protease [Betaproteobacteria bacterium]MBP6647445.1 TIGR02281 family clan AA aspartic protease [Burkholderiaceae bacterium]
MSIYTFIQGATLALLAQAAIGQQVALNGVLGTKALLIVDGSAPKSVAPGETHQGVKVVSASGDSAVVEVKGQRVNLRVGDAPASVGTKANGAAGTRIVLPVGSGGHFMSAGKINGREVNFMVDTGATMVALAVADAERIGLNYKSGQAMQANTANGVSQAWHVKLGSVRIGDVEVRDVDAAVVPQGMPFVLLGNSFLNRFKMQRDAGQMTLERRY